MPNETLIDKLNAEIAVGREVHDCGEVFLAQETASDPVAPWAASAAAEAESRGWRVTSMNSVVCPLHEQGK